MVTKAQLEKLLEDCNGPIPITYRDTILKWTQQAIRIQEEERFKHYRNTDRDKVVAAKAKERIEYYTNLMGWLMELRLEE